jgi:hypothetical protein
MAGNEQPAAKKILIDEDWKSQVAAEKAQAAQTRAASGDLAGEEGAEAASPPLPAEQETDLPPASFLNLILSLGTEAMMAMGQIPHPADPQPYVDRQQARYLIDMLDMLREKTQGNLNDAEQEAIVDLLHQLRMRFIRL